MEVTRRAAVSTPLRPVNGPTFEESLRCLAGAAHPDPRLSRRAAAAARTNYLLIKGIEAVGVRIGGPQRSPPRDRRRQHQDASRTGAQGKLNPASGAASRWSGPRSGAGTGSIAEVIGKVVLVG